MTPRTKWTRDELLIALNLYHKLTFGQMHARQPVVQQVASKLGRTASSFGMKLCNLASFDPALKLRGIKGLSGASKLDQEVWNEFHSHLNEAAPASEEALRQLFEVADDCEMEVRPKHGIVKRKRPAAGATEVVANVKLRRGQEYFRESVLNNFGGRCGVSGLAVRDLLVASHILPWASHPDERLNVRNGLCLSRLHDAAFDRGLIAFDPNLRLVLSRKLRDELSEPVINDYFGKYSGEALHLPEDAALPDLKFLAKHRSLIFDRAA
jgi:putative restriction endonuclease